MRMCARGPGQIIAVNQDPAQRPARLLYATTNASNHANYTQASPSRALPANAATHCHHTRVCARARAPTHTRPRVRTMPLTMPTC